MPLPTLLRKGFLIPPDYASAVEKTEMADTVPIQYIMNFLSDKTPSRRGTEPRQKAKSFGDKVIVLKSSTGSGKSTALPASLFLTFGERTGKNFVITQPRVLTAIDIATKIPDDYPTIKLDVNIGYSTGSFKRLPKEKGVIFCTVGTVTQQLTSMTAEEFMKRYSYVIIDEVHDRSLETDTCLFLLKKLLKDNFADKECPMVILMSATFNEKIFIDFFEVPRQNFIQVEGQTFHKEVHFPAYSVTDGIKYASILARKIHLENFKDIVENRSVRDILIFVHVNNIVHEIAQEMHQFNSKLYRGEVPSVHELDQALQHLKVQEKSGGGGNLKNYILPVELTSATFKLGGLDYQNLFADMNAVWVPVWKNEKEIGEKKPDTWVRPTRRIIVCTNVAETGVTIDTLKYCIDTGYVMSVEFNPEIDCSLMLEKNVTQGMAVQRKGRVGRKAPGDWYPVFTEETMGKFQENQFPNIIVEDVSNVLLSIILRESQAQVVPAKKKDRSWYKHALNDPTKYILQQNASLKFEGMDFIELPSADSINYAIHKLFGLGFIDAQLQVTPFGYYSNQIRFLTLEAKRMIFSGFTHRVNILQLITIATLVEVSPRLLKSGKKLVVPPILLGPDQSYYFNNGIQDTFIESLCIFELFQEEVAASVRQLYKAMLHAHGKPVKYDCESRIKAWCAKHELDYEGWLLVVQKRDEYISLFLEVGINIFYSQGETMVQLLRRGFAESLEYIKRIKSCIRDGYGMRLLQWNAHVQGYQSVLRKTTVTVKSPIISKQNPPQFLVCNDFLVVRSMKGFYEIKAGDFVSVLDNFVDVDETLYI